MKKRVIFLFQYFIYPSRTVPLALLRLGCHTVGFLQILAAPKRLQICMMEATSLLLWIAEIEGGARHDMINVNVAVPRHALGEQPFNILATLVGANAQQRFRGRRLAIAFEDVAHAFAQVMQQPESGIRSTTLAHVFAIVCHLLFVRLAGFALDP